MADIEIDLTETPIEVTVELTTVAGSFTEASIDHTVISNVGTNTHAQIDTFIAANPALIDAKTDKNEAEGTGDFISGAMNTGVLTGGDVTVNADNTKFDVAAGTGVIMDWITPATPTRTMISWSAFTAEDIPNLATGIFTAIAIEDVGSGVAGLVKQSSVRFTNGERRKYIVLQGVTHTSGTQIDVVSSNSSPAYEAISAILDYIRALGPVNKDNDYSANGANLQVDKASGRTILPFINRANDPQNPTEETNASGSSIAMTRAYQDGVGGDVFAPGNTVVDPDNWDDGSGTLASVSANKWQIQRFYFFGQTQASTVTYGQAEYASLVDAKAAILTESPSVSLFLEGGSFVTALCVKVGATDLSDIAQAEFVCMGTR